MHELTFRPENGFESIWFDTDPAVLFDIWNKSGQSTARFNVEAYLKNLTPHFHQYVTTSYSDTFTEDLERTEVGLLAGAITADDVRLAMGRLDGQWKNPHARFIARDWVGLAHRYPRFDTDTVRALWLDRIKMTENPYTRAADALEFSLSLTAWPETRGSFSHEFEWKTVRHAVDLLAGSVPFMPEELAGGDNTDVTIGDVDRMTVYLKRMFVILKTYEDIPAADLMAYEAMFTAYRAGFLNLGSHPENFSFRDILTLSPCVWAALEGIQEQDRKKAILDKTFSIARGIRGKSLHDTLINTCVSGYCDIGEIDSAYEAWTLYKNPLNLWEVPTGILIEQAMRSGRLNTLSPKIKSILYSVMMNLPSGTEQEHRTEADRLWDMSLTYAILGISNVDDDFRMNGTILEPTKPGPYCFDDPEILQCIRTGRHLTHEEVAALMLAYPETDAAGAGQERLEAAMIKYNSGKMTHPDRVRDLMKALLRLTAGTR